MPLNRRLPDGVRALAVTAMLDALAVLSPIDCAGCGSADRALCTDCCAELQPRVEEHTLPGGLRVHSAVVYEGAPRAALLAFKESGRTDVARALAAPLREAIRAAVIDSDTHAVLVTVPTSRAAWRRRGYDPVRLLCRRAGLVPVRALSSIRSTASQKTLGIDDRARNLIGSMVSQQWVAGRDLLLVDDVLTTGATFVEAARALAESGAASIRAATLAFTPRRNGLG